MPDNNPDDQYGHCKNRVEKAVNDNQLCFINDAQLNALRVICCFALWNGGKIGNCDSLVVENNEMSFRLLT